MRMLTAASIVSGLVFAARISPGQTVIYDSNGFEPPTFSPGTLEGQDPANGPWVRTPGSGTATIQSGTVASGLQAVQLNRSGEDIRFAVAKSIDNVGLSLAPTIYVDWSMNYLAANLPAGSFGPFVGIEVYDASSGSPLLAASAGVDATTAELLFQQPVTGFFDVVSGVTVAPNTWHDYRLALNYSTLEYQLSLDGTTVLTSAFVDPSVTDFTDADLSALAAAGDPASLDASVTGFIDNFQISQVPEPGVMALGVAGALIVAAARLRRGRNV